jgi:hypothetical protein
MPLPVTAIPSLWVLYRDARVMRIPNFEDDMMNALRGKVTLKDVEATYGLMTDEPAGCVALTVVHSLYHHYSTISPHD